MAIENAIYPDVSEICSTLVIIDDDNKSLFQKIINNEKYILTVAWKSTAEYYITNIDTFYNTGQYNIWVTTAPELLNRFRQFQNCDTIIRIKQLLGLPPNSVWVRPQDLFRPSPDDEINDNTCNICFDGNTKKKHIQWINKNRISRYYQCELYNRYP